MSGATRFRDSKRKLDWADEHINNLQSSVDTILKDPGPYRLSEERDSDSGQWYVVVRIRNADDTIKALTSVALQCGDILGNLKSALDYMVWALIRERQRANPTDSTLVPSKAEGKRIGFRCQDANPKGIAATLNDYESGVSAHKHFTGDDTVALMKTVEAYQGGKGHDLWRLDALNNINKHRLVLTANTALASYTIMPRMPKELVEAIDTLKMPPFLRHMMVNSGVGFAVNSKRVVLEDGAILFGPHDSKFSEGYHYPDPAFDIALHEPAVLGDPSPIVDLLRTSHTSISNTVTKFEALKNPVP